MRLVWGTVLEMLESFDDLLRMRVELDAEQGEREAIAYPDLSGPCGTGDRVLLNCTAVDLGLGTGGNDLVVATIPAVGEPGGIVLDDRSGGHIMKMRYTPLQRDVLSVEEQDSPHHSIMASATRLDGMPVVCCGLHSHLPMVAAAIKEKRPDSKVAYLMTDEATLALAMSRTVRQCLSSGLVDKTISVGQAFGGDLEAVNTYSGLLAARHIAGADVAVVAIGPGVAGTGTPLGHGGIAQGLAVNAAASLGGRPICVLRLSFADVRERHRGVSHHSLTALGSVALRPSVVAVPRLPSELAHKVDDDLSGAGVWEMHERGDSQYGLDDLPDTRGVSMGSMGRGVEDDPAFFAAAAAAGDLATRV